MGGYSAANEPVDLEAMNAPQLLGEERNQSFVALQPLTPDANFKPPAISAMTIEDLGGDDNSSDGGDIPIDVNSIPMSSASAGGGSGEPKQNIVTKQRSSLSRGMSSSKLGPTPEDHGEHEGMFSQGEKEGEHNAPPSPGKKDR